MSDKPIKQPPVLFEQTQKIISEIEDRLEITLLTYWNSNDGSLCDNDVVALYEVMQNSTSVKPRFLRMLLGSPYVPKSRH